MARLIDADALIQRIDKGTGLVGIGLEPVMAIRDIKALISAMPTVDAEPVRTATLIRETDRERHWHCSGCGKVFGLTGLMYKYCPECGARLMGGGRDAD